MGYQRRVLGAWVWLVACAASPTGSGTSFEGSTTVVTEGSSGAGTSSSSTTLVDESSTAVDGSTSSSGGSSSDSGTTGGPPADPGCPECIVLAEGLAGGRGITVDATHVYFTDQTAGTVSRVPKGGGELEVLAPGRDAPYDVAIGGAWVYWTEFVANGTVARMPSAGGVLDVLDDAADHPRAIAVGGTHVYWTSFGSGTGGVWRHGLSGDATEQLLSALAGISDIAIDDTMVDVTSHDPDPSGGGVGFIEEPPEVPAVGAIVSVPLTGDPDGTATQILASGLAQPWGLAMVGTSVFWADGDGAVGNHPNAVMSMQPSGSPASPIAVDQSAPWGVAADASAVYWTDSTEVKTAPHTGGDPIVLATMQNSARSIAVDDSAVYWITQDRVLQRPKP